MNAAAQIAHYSAVRARLYGAARRQWIKRPWSTPIVTEVTRPVDPTDWSVREVMAREHVTIRAIIDIVAAAHGVSKAEIIGTSKVARILKPRHLAMTLAHMKLGNRESGSLPAIGRVFGRDHTTVLNAVRKCREVVERIMGGGHADQ